MSPREEVAAQVKGQCPGDRDHAQVDHWGRGVAVHSCQQPAGPNLAPPQELANAFLVLILPLSKEYHSTCEKRMKYRI